MLFNMLTLLTRDAPLAHDSVRFARRTKILRLCPLLLSALFLPGCADSYLGARAVLVPGKFDVNTCEQLSGMHKALSTKIEALERLQRKAESETVGMLVGGMAYGPTVVQARAERRIVEETQAEKQCEQKPSP